SVRAVAAPIDTPRFSVFPGKRELTAFNESVNDLRYANFSARIEDAPSEIAKLLGKHFPTEATILIEPAIDLNSEFFSARLEDGLIEPARDLKSEFVLVKPVLDEIEYDSYVEKV